MYKKKFPKSSILDKLAGCYFRWCPNCGAGKEYLRQKGGDMRCVECGFEWDMLDYYYDRNTKSYVRKDDSDDDCRSKKMKHCPYCDSTNIRYADNGGCWGQMLK